MALFKIIAVFFSVVIFPIGFAVFFFYLGVIYARKEKIEKRIIPITSDSDESEEGVVVV